MTELRDVVDRTATAVGWQGSVAPQLGWDTVERRLETPLPGDFKEFMGRFPSGMFREVVRVVNPVQSDEFLTTFKDEFDRDCGDPLGDKGSPPRRRATAGRAPGAERGWRVARRSG